MTSSNQLFQRQIKSGKLSRPSRLKFRKSHSTMASNWLETILTPPSPLRALTRSGRRWDLFVLWMRHCFLQVCGCSFTIVIAIVDVILSMCRCSNWFHSVIRLFRKNLHVSSLMTISDASLPTRPTWLDHGSKIRWRYSRLHLCSLMVLSFLEEEKSRMMNLCLHGMMFVGDRADINWNEWNAGRSADQPPSVWAEHHWIQTQHRPTGGRPSAHSGSTYIWQQIHCLHYGGMHMQIH